VPSCGSSLRAGAACGHRQRRRVGGARRDQLEIEPVKSVDPLRPLAHVRANAVEVGDDRVLSTLSRTLGAGADVDAAVRPRPSASRAGVPTPPPRTPRSASSSAGPSASSRPLAQVRRDDRRHRAGYRCGLGRRPRYRRVPRIRFRGNRFRIRRRGRSDTGTRCRAALHAGLHPGARAASVSPGSTTPTSTTAAPSWSLPVSVAAPTTRNRWSTSRPAPDCARSTSIWTRRPRSCAGRSVPKSKVSKRFRGMTAPSPSPRAVG